MDTSFLCEEKEEMKEDTLKLLTGYCAEYKHLQALISRTKEEVKKYEHQLQGLARVKIPALLNSACLSEIKLKSGEKVEVEEKLHASIANKNTQAAYKSMVDAEGGDEAAEEKIKGLFKENLIVNDVTEELKQYLLEQGSTYDLKKTIHWSTLNSYCKSRLGEGKDIPENISVFQYQETQIK